MKAAYTRAAQAFAMNMIDTADETVAILRRTGKAEMEANALTDTMGALGEVVYHARQAVIAAQTSDEPVMTLILARALREVLIATDLHRDSELPKY